MSLTQHWKFEDISSGQALNEIPGGSLINAYDSKLADSSSKFGNGITGSNGGGGALDLVDRSVIVSAISLWFRIPIQQESQYLVKTPNYSIELGNGNLRDKSYNSSGLTCTDTLWHHLWIVKGTGNYAIVYLDGVQGTNELFFPLNYSTAYSFGGYSSYYLPDFDNIQFYDHIPSASEIALLATATSQDTIILSPIETDVDFISSVPEIASYGMIEGIDFVVPCPELESIAINPIVCDIDFCVPAPEISVDVTDDISDLDIRFGMVNIESSLIGLNSLTLNSIIVDGNYEVLPELDSVAVNPIVCNVDYNSPHAELNARTGDEISFVIGCPRIGSVAVNPIVAEIDLNGHSAEINTSADVGSVGVVSICAPLSKVEIETLTTLTTSVNFIAPKGKLSSVALVTIYAQIDVNAPICKIKGKTKLDDSYNVIAYKRNRQCSMN